MGKGGSLYLHRKRLIILLDRRKASGGEQYGKNDGGEGDDLWMYEPPKNCRDIPRDVVPDWHLAASKTSLLPDVQYGDGSDMKKKEKNVEETANIGSADHCNGTVLTLSSIVRAEDQIKTYLYWNAQGTRFVPEDVKHVFPRIMNMEWNAGQFVSKGKRSRNQVFLQGENANNKNGSKVINQLIKDMEGNLKDTTFNFYPDE